MSKQSVSSGGDQLVIGQALARIRRRLGVTQREGAEAHEDDISYQYFGMHETGKVSGLVKPATQQKMLAAIGRAARPPVDLTIDDLAAEVEALRLQKENAYGPGMDEDASGFDMERALRMSKALAPPRSAGEQAPTNTAGAVFPTRDGDVVISLPPKMSPEAFRELRAYFDVFIKARGGD